MGIHLVCSGPCWPGLGPGLADTHHCLLLRLPPVLFPIQCLQLLQALGH